MGYSRLFAFWTLRYKCAPTSLGTWSPCAGRCGSRAWEEGEDRSQASSRTCSSRSRTENRDTGNCFIGYKVLVDWIRVDKRGIRRMSITLTNRWCWLPTKRCHSELATSGISLVTSYINLVRMRKEEERRGKGDSGNHLISLPLQERTVDDLLVILFCLLSPCQKVQLLLAILSPTATATATARELRGLASHSTKPL